MPVGNKQSPAHEAHTFLLWFYAQYSRYVYKLAWQTCNNPSDVDDLVQEVWLRLCAKGDLLIDFSKERHLSYITATVKNTAISLARKQTSEYPLEFVHTISYDEAEMLNRIFDRQMKLQHFREVWKLVPPDSRELLERKYTLFETNEEIARDLGIKPGSVRMYLTRARKAAYTVLAQHKDDLI